MSINQLIVVDYLDGAGGEYLAHFISSHLQNFPLQDNMQDIDQSPIKFLNSESLIRPDWNTNFEYYFNQFKQSVTGSWAVPYHLYKWPQHIDIIKQHPGTRFVKINSKEDSGIVCLDFIRKVYRSPVPNTTTGFQRLQHRISLWSQELKTQAMKHFRTGEMLYMDIDIIETGQQPTEQTRNQLIDAFIQRKKTCPSQDITVEYRDFFVTPNVIAYYKLCDHLMLIPDLNRWQVLCDRNWTNYQSLLAFQRDCNIL